MKLKRNSDAEAGSDRNWEIVGTKSSVIRNIGELDCAVGGKKKTLFHGPITGFLLIGPGLTLFFFFFPFCYLFIYLFYLCGVTCDPEIFVGFYLSIPLDLFKKYISCV